MRTVAACFLLVAATLVPQQSSSDFQSLYGKSDEERFVVRPGIYVVVRYGADEMASELNISAVPQAPDAHAAKFVIPHPSLTKAQAAELTDEFAPPGLRGALIRDDAGRGWRDTSQYENVTIERYKTDCSDIPQRIPPVQNCIESVGIVYKHDGATGTGGAKSVTEYRSRFGTSDLERFMVRPEVALTVEYAGADTACQLQTQLDGPLVSDTMRDTYMSETLATEIEDEVAPRSLRGDKLPGRSLTQMGRIYESSEEYVGASVSRGGVDCKRPEGCIFRSTIQFKKKQCAGLIQRTGTPPGVFSSAGTAR